MFCVFLGSSQVPALCKDGERTRPSSDCHGVQGESLLCPGHGGVGTGSPGSSGPRQECGGAVSCWGLQEGQELPAGFHAPLHVQKGTSDCDENLLVPDIIMCLCILLHLYLAEMPCKPMNAMHHHSR